MDDQEYLNEALSTNVTEDGDLEDLFAFLRQDDLKQLIILTAVLSLLFVVGCVGNSIVIAVSCVSAIKQTSTHLIIALAVTDLIILTVAIPGVLIKNWSYPFKLDTVCKVWEFIRMTTVPMSAFILMAIAFDRYFLICVKSYRHRSKLFLRFSAVSILVCSTGLGILPMMAVGVYQRESDGVTKYLGLCMPNFLMITPKVLDDYWKFVTALMSVILLTVITLYIMVFIKVYKQSHKWNSFRQKKIYPAEVKSTYQEKIYPAEDKQRHQKTMQDPSENNQRCNKSKKDANENNPGHRFSKTIQSPINNKQQGSRENKTKTNAHDKDEQSQNKPQELFIIELDSCKRNNLGDNAMSLHQGKAKHSLYTIPKSHDRKLNPIPEDKADGSSSSSVENSQTRNAEHQDDENKSVRDTTEKVIYHQTSNLGRHRAHMKTAKVLFVVTVIYFISYCPTFLMSCDVIPDDNLFLFYSYFLHSAANPIVYSFMNKQFRYAVKKLLLCYK